MINHLIIELNLGRDWEVKTTPSGKLVAKSSGFIDSGYYDKNKSEWVKKGDWANIEFWLNDEKQLKGTAKGARILVEGSLSLDPYTTQEGVKRLAVVLKAREIARIQKNDAHAHEPAEDVPAPAGDGDYDPFA